MKLEELEFVKSNFHHQINVLSGRVSDGPPSHGACESDMWGFSRSPDYDTLLSDIIGRFCPSVSSLFRDGPSSLQAV